MTSWYSNLHCTQEELKLQMQVGKHLLGQPDGKGARTYSWP